MSILCAIPLLSLLFACSEPKVSYETIKLQRSTTIDCNGGTYNKGKVTELQILADNVTIKRCKINGSSAPAGLVTMAKPLALKQALSRQGTLNEHKQQHQKTRCFMPSPSLVMGAYHSILPLAPRASQCMTAQ
jgi:hypothetical protein